MKTKLTDIKIKNAIKIVKQALQEKIQLEFESEKLESREINEIAAVLDYGLEPLELMLMEECGLKFIEIEGLRLYNQLEFEFYYDQLIDNSKDDDI